MLSVIFNMSFFSFYLIIKGDDLIMFMVISYIISFAYHIFGFKILKNKLYSVLSMLFVLFIFISINNYTSIYKEYNHIIGNKEIEELIAIKN